MLHEAWLRLGQQSFQNRAHFFGAGAEAMRRILVERARRSGGRPFFVMELVRGVKITDHCDEKQLSTRERVELFITVCQAVQHAHQKGIIHRDVNPSNILVTINDGKAVSEAKVKRLEARK